MKTAQFQKGLSPIGVLFVVAVAGFGLFVVMKLLPHYLDYNAIKKVHEKIAQEPTIYDLSDRKLKDRVDLLLTTHQVRSYDTNQSYLDDSGDGPVFGFKYSIKEPIVANVSAVLDFAYEAEIPQQ